MSQPMTLDYAPATPKTRRWFRRAMRSVAVVGLLVAICAWGPPLYRRARLAYWTYRCLNYSAPSDKVILEWDSTRLIKADSSLALFENFATAYDPDVQALCAYSTTPIYFTRQSARWVPVGSNLSIGFIGGLQRPDGTPIILQFDISNDSSNMQARADFSAMSVHSIMERAADRWNTTAITTNPKGSVHAKFFAGQVDPMNPSHFTLEYEIDGIRHVLDGWVKQDDILVVARPDTIPGSPSSRAQSPERD